MTDNMKIFVFGSNLAGVHGAGSAAHAFRHCGAVWGQGVGLQGASYAIPTKDQNIQTMPLNRISPYVAEFIEFAKANPEMEFEIVAIGCGLAGYRASEIALLFKDSPANCKLPVEFIQKRER